MEDDAEEYTESPIADHAENIQNHDAINHRSDSSGARRLASENSTACPTTMHRIPRSMSNVELSGHSSSGAIRRRLRSVTAPLHQAVPRPRRRAPNDALQLEEESLEERVVAVEVGPLWDHDHATTIAREYELEHPDSRWTGIWNTTIPGLMSVITIVVSPDTTKMQAAIQSGKMEPVYDLLQGLTDSQQKAQLCATYGSPGYPDKNDLNVRTTPILYAAQCGNSGAFSTLLHATRRMLKSQLKDLMKATDGIGRTVLAMAASSGKVGTFETVLAAVKNELDPTEVSAMMRAKDSQKRSLLSFAAESMDADTFKAVQRSLERMLSEEEMYGLIDPEDYLGNKLLLQAVKSDKGKNICLLKAVLKAVRRCFLFNNEVRGQELLCRAIRCCEIDLFQKTPDFVKEHLADRKAAEEISTIFSEWVDKRVWVEDITLAVEEHTKEKIDEFFQNLLHGNKLLDWVKTCLSGPLVSSENPFVPGLKLSVAFSRAAEKAPEGERRNLLYLQQTVDKFLLEVLERLPQTVRGCKGRMNCSALFEPETQDEVPTPLQMMVGKRKQRLIYCKAPLVMDYLSVRFIRGLPDLLDTDGILRDKERQGSPVETNDGIVAGVSDDMETPSARSTVSRKASLVFLGLLRVMPYLRHVGMLLQGSGTNLPNLAGIPIVGQCPGLQFIITGIAVRPDIYYHVPMLRMAFEFVVYVAMLSVFSSSVLLYPDGELRPVEVIFFVSFVAAGAIREVREIVRGLEAYFEDRWNILDVLGLAWLAGGFLVRSIDSTSPWGRALYALGAPVVFSRLLFFAQILPFQGPMIQVIFSMTVELIQFGGVMLVAILGFVMAFFALLKDDATFGETWLNLFKAMLGEVGLFDDFGDQIQDDVATLLLIMYLVIINIMFLNLLIAVLSTAHSKVEANAEREFKVSKARVIQHYEMTVKNELLPAPFSVVQLALSWLFAALKTCCQHCSAYQIAEHFQKFETATKRAFGRVVFWLVVGPVAVMAGVLLWVISVFYAPYAWTKYYMARNKPATMLQRCKQIALLALQWIVVAVWCGLVAPLCLVTMWLVAPLSSSLKWLKSGRHLGGENRGSDDLVWPGLHPSVGAQDSFNVNEILLHAPGGVDTRDLFAYLVDPMNDPEVRQDELNRQTTVEHMKFLRNRLEKTAKKQIDGLRTMIGVNINELRGETRQREQELEQKLDVAMQGIEETRQREHKLEQKLDEAMLILGNVDLILRNNIRGT